MRNGELAADLRVRERYPAVAQALLAGASGQLRNLATVGGNLLQRTRCSYFQDVTKPCNKRQPGSGCPARDGEHRNLAIFGWSKPGAATHRPTSRSPGGARRGRACPGHERGARDPARRPASPAGRRPGATPCSTTATDDPVEAASAARGLAYGRCGRASYAFAVVSLAAAIKIEGGVVREVRLALGGVAHAPWRARRAEELLRNAPATEQDFTRAAEAELAEARPLRDNAYKVPLAQNLIVMR